MIGAPIAPARSRRHFCATTFATSPNEQHREGAIVFVPSATAQALHLIVADMIRGDSGAWLDLRHLHDVARTARSPEGVDFGTGSTQFSPQRLRRRRSVQGARALEDLFEVAVPLPARRAGTGAVRHAARLFCATRACASAVLVGNLSQPLTSWHGYAWRGRQKLREQISKRFAYEGAGSRLSFAASLLKDRATRPFAGPRFSTM